jgi:hypothetical protein
MADRASARVRKILETTPPNLPEPKLAAELRRIMEVEARAAGFSDLPAHGV